MIVDQSLLRLVFRQVLFFAHKMMDIQTRLNVHRKARNTDCIFQQGQTNIKAQKISAMVDLPEMNPQVKDCPVSAVNGDKR